MLNKAIEKLKIEVDANKNNEYVKCVGEFLINFVGEHLEATDKIMAADKTIAKSLDEMKKVASTKKVGNMAMFTPQEGFAIVMKYFGIETGSAPAQIIEKPKVVKPSIDFDIKLENFL